MKMPLCCSYQDIGLIYCKQSLTPLTHCINHILYSMEIHSHWPAVQGNSTHTVSDAHMMLGEVMNLHSFTSDWVRVLVSVHLVWSRVMSARRFYTLPCLQKASGMFTLWKTSATSLQYLNLSDLSVEIQPYVCACLNIDIGFRLIAQ